MAPFQSRVLCWRFLTPIPGRKPGRWKLQLTLKVESLLSSISGIEDIHSTSTRGRAFVRFKITPNMNPEKVQRVPCFGAATTTSRQGIAPQIRLSQSGKRDGAIALGA
ncbi:MAG: hypothetical protein R3C61_03810 [Bacteroidia bacterium]